MDRRRFLLIATAVPLGAAIPSAALANDDPPPPQNEAPPPLDLVPDPQWPSAVYLPIAPPTAYGVETAKLVLHLSIKNKGTAPKTIDGITYAFPGSGVPSVAMQGVQMLMANGGVIAPNHWSSFANGAGVQLDPADDTSVVRNDVYLPVPVPPVLRIRIFAAGFAYPAEYDFALLPYDVAHRLPYFVEDLRPGECIQMVGSHGSGSNTGVQVYAHDVGVMGWDNEWQRWSLLLPGAPLPNGLVNTDHRIWNLPLRAGEPGIVKSAVDGIDDNAGPGAPVITPGYGNYVEVEHANQTRAFYCHLRKGTVAVTAGQEVAYGDLLGRVGHSGNSSHAHTHIEAKAKFQGQWRWRPWALTESWLVAETELGEWDPGSPTWVPANGRGVPPVSTLIWPSGNMPIWYRPHIPEFIEIDFPPHIWVRILERARRCDYEPVRFGGYELDGAARAFSLFRPAGQAPVVARSGLSGAQLADELTARQRDGYRPVALSSYQDGGVRYACILRRQSGPNWSWYAGVSVEEHQARMATLRREGFHPASVEVTMVDRTASVTAWHERQSSTVETTLLLSPREHASAVASHAARGRYLAYVSATRLESGEARLSGVFSDAVGAAPAFAGLDRATLIRRQETLAREGALTRALAAYVEDGVIRFAGA